MINLVAMGIGLNGLDKGYIGRSAGNAMQIKPDMRQDHPTGACRTVVPLGYGVFLGTYERRAPVKPFSAHAGGICACSWMQNCSADAAVKGFRPALLALWNYLLDPLSGVCCKASPPHPSKGVSTIYQLMLM